LFNLCAIVSNKTTHSENAKQKLSQMKLTPEEIKETINNLPKGWLSRIYMLKKGTVSKRTIQRIVLEGCIDLHAVMPIAVELAANEILRKATERKDLEKAKGKLKAALKK